METACLSETSASTCKYGVKTQDFYGNTIIIAMRTSNLISGDYVRRIKKLFKNTNIDIEIKLKLSHYMP
jgi:hypothetical protein